VRRSFAFTLASTSVLRDDLVAVIRGRQDRPADDDQQVTPLLDELGVSAGYPDE
jgi:hypothetical protein